MTWIKTGTVSLTNGSAVITGAGTSWVDVGVLNPGDMYAGADGKFYEVLSYQSNTGLTLTSNYLGTTASGQPYSIIPLGMLPSAVALSVKNVLTAQVALMGNTILATPAQSLTSTQQGNARANIAALGAADVGAGRLVKSVAGGVDVTLSAAEAANQFIELTGTLTANINLIVPAAPRLFVFRNTTTGSFTLNVKTAAGTGVTVIQSGRMFIECDGTNCVDLLSHMRQLGGSIDGTPVGINTPAAVGATTLTAISCTAQSIMSETMPSQSMGGGPADSVLTVLDGSTYLVTVKEDSITSPPQPGTMVIINRTGAGTTVQTIVAGTAMSITCSSATGYKIRITKTGSGGYYAKVSILCLG